ncbi:nuclear transport factor 2 family protein [Mycobacterium kyorinense]|uniref:SnoaL-like domain-containing protein n=1 Tax=Mycobacterium kyorinense TaxID=487514 RepID=A0A1X1YDF3_9MYCO|nr:nuclear transport factor 2 family protein [Mycobacterium kyorinense]ORW09030.1 hypothetical protein AWC14_22215 [Mycobacterium kyorinense]
MSSNPILDDLTARIEKTWNERDLDAAMELYTDDIMYRDFSTGRELHGIDAVRRHAAAVFRRFDMAWTVTAIQPFADVDGGIIFWNMRGGLIGAHASIDSYGLDYVLIRDGKFSRDDVYFDSAQLAPLALSLRDAPAIVRFGLSRFGLANAAKVARAMVAATATRAVA